MSSFTQFVPTRMEVGNIAEATLMAIATAPDKRVALELLHTLCREHAILPGDEYVNDRGNILLAISKRQ